MIVNRLFASVLVFSIFAMPSVVSAQWVVYDPTNYAQAVLRFQQLVQEYQLLLQQTRQLPVDLAARYRVPTLPWPSHDTVADYAEPLLRALNEGDRTGMQYTQTVDPLASVQVVLDQIPIALRPRVGTGYATIELADRIARTAVDRAGALRMQGENVLRTIQALEDDAVSTDPRFHSQVALLNKINGTNVLGLRIAEQTNQSVLTAVEQLLVANKRQRDAETKQMNAQLYQWQYGPAYGEDLFRLTAVGLDTWRQP
jgi:hypothetical protein